MADTKAETKIAPKANPYAGMMPNEVMHNLTGGGAGAATPKRGDVVMRPKTPNQIINTLTQNFAGSGINSGTS
jgi:hypothetical protein